MGSTEENPPVVVGGRLQWMNAAKVLAAVLAVITPAVVTSRSMYVIAKAETAAKVAEAEARAKQAKQAAEAGFQLTKDYVQSLEHRISALEAAAKRAQTGHPARRPIPVVLAPKPKPLPRDLNAAERQISKGGAVAPAPTIVPLPITPRPADTGP